MAGRVVLDADEFEELVRNTARAMIDEIEKVGSGSLTAWGVLKEMQKNNPSLDLNHSDEVRFAVYDEMEGRLLGTDWTMEMRTYASTGKAARTYVYRPASQLSTGTPPALPTGAMPDFWDN